MQRLLIVPEVVRNCAPSNSADADADRSERISSPNFFELREGVEQTASSVALTLRSLTILCRVQNILVAKGFAFPAKTPTPNNTSITALPLSTTSSYQKHCALRCISTDRGRAMLCQAAR